MASECNDANHTAPPALFEGLRALLCPPVPDRDPDFDRLRYPIEVRIRPCLPGYEKAIGVTASSPQFLEDLAQAILLCILVNIAPPERLSEIQKRLLSISIDARSAAESLERLDSALQQTTLIYPGFLGRYSELVKKGPELVSLAELARGHADALPPDKGGQRGMVAYRALIGSLARAFESATGRAAKVTWNYPEDEIRGEILQFMRGCFCDCIGALARHASPVH